MATLALVNPRRRRKMSALQKKYFGGARKKRVRASNPRKRRTHARRHNVYLNPHRRSRRSITRAHHVRRRNPSTHSLSLKSIGSQVMPTLQSGLIGASGALGLDLLWGYVSPKLPTSIAGSAIAQYGAKLLGAILVGVAGNMVMKGKGRDLAVGATTVVLHDALKAQLKSSFPTLPLGEYLTYAPTVGGPMGRPRILSTGMGEYLNGLGGDAGSTSNSSVLDNYDGQSVDSGGFDMSTGDYQY